VHDLLGCIATACEIGLVGLSDGWVERFYDGDLEQAKRP
jgi:hypothetical protein